MRITVDVELQEDELTQAARVQEALQAFRGVDVHVATNKSALACRLSDAMASKKTDVMAAELLERFTIPALFDETLDVLCSAVLFSVERYERGDTPERLVAVLVGLPEPLCEKAKTEVVRRAMLFLSMPRRHSCSRAPLLPYAETIAYMTKMELLHIRSVLVSVLQMIQTDTTRTAGMTCLGKLVECAHEVLRACDGQTLEALRVTVATAQQDDTYLYDVEYIMEALGWSQNKPLVTLRGSGLHHAHPILTLAYCGGSSNAREAVVTSSVDGAIGTWDGVGVLTENILLSRHYASSLDLASRGRVLIVGTIGRYANTPPAVVLYDEEVGLHECRWEESGAVEPKNARFITCVRSIRSSMTPRYCVAVNTTSANAMLLYDRTQLVQEYHDHTDMITAMHIPHDRDTTVVTGSRDCGIMVYDLRTRQGVATTTHHYSTVSAIGSCGDYIFTGGLDKRLVVEDMRMLGHQLHTRDMESAVLALSVNSSMQCAVAAMTGVYVINFASNAMLPASSRADSGIAAPRYNAVAWNAAGTLLFCGGDTMSLDVYARNYVDGDAYEVA